MRVAVSGSHGTGKSTLIARFLERRPHYAHEPEAFETLADDIDLTSDEGPTPEGLQALLEYSATEVALHPPGTCVVHERCPVDYLAYAIASRRTWSSDDVSRFLARYVPTVRASLRHLDLVVLLPVSMAGPVRGRAGEDAGYRRRVDESLKCGFLDDDYDLFGPDAARVVELSPVPDRQLSELIRLTTSDAHMRQRN